VNPFPAALLLSLAVTNIVAWRDAELMYNGVTDGSAKLVPRQGSPTALIETSV
jgi:hypothetical protein